MNVIKKIILIILFVFIYTDNTSAATTIQKECSDAAGGVTGLPGWSRPSSGNGVPMHMDSDELYRIQQNTNILMYKECVLDKIAIAEKQKILNKITKETMEFLNNGFDGTPAFITNQKKYRQKITKDTIDKFVNKDISKVCGSLKPEVSKGIQNIYNKSISNDPKHKPYACASSSAQTNPFSSGFTWSAFLTSIQPSNNPFSVFALTLNDVSNQIDENISDAYQELDWGNGYKSLKKHEADGTYSIVTPGSLIKDIASSSTMSGLRQLENADEYDEITQEPVAKIHNIVLKSGMSNASNYVNRIINNSSAPTTPQLIPQPPGGSYPIPGGGIIGPGGGTGGVVGPGGGTGGVVEPGECEEGQPDANNLKYIQDDINAENYRISMLENTKKSIQQLEEELDQKASLCWDNIINWSTNGVKINIEKKICTDNGQKYEDDYGNKVCNVTSESEVDTEWTESEDYQTKGIHIDATYTSTSDSGVTVSDTSSTTKYIKKTDKTKEVDSALNTLTDEIENSINNSKDIITQLDALSEDYKKCIITTEDFVEQYNNTTVHYIGDSNNEKNKYIKIFTTIRQQPTQWEHSWCSEDNWEDHIID